jgi:hypothetical protein
VPKTLQDRLCAALLARGYQEIAGRSRKFRVFEPKGPDAPNANKFYVGKAGAFRTGMNLTDSVSMTRGRFYAILLSEVAA